MHYQTIGSRIKQKRTELGLTQRQVKEKTGISSGNLSEIENGSKLPSSPTLIALSNLLDCSIDWILKGEASTSSSQQFSNESEQALIEGFRLLSPEDREDIMSLLNTKLRRLKRDNQKLETLSNSQALPDTYLTSAE